MTTRKTRKAGHRSWAAGNRPVPGEHCGDIMSREKRSALMSRIRSKNTSPERILCRILRKAGVSFSCHVRDLPGRPDIVFREKRVAVFVDGDFWHGWRFPLWKHKLSPQWCKKIDDNRKRDKRNFRRLRAAGWKIIRIWEHQVECSPEKCASLVVQVVESTRDLVHTRADGQQARRLLRGAVDTIRPRR